jgi:hypothetical protein
LASAEAALSGVLSQSFIARNFVLQDFELVDLATLAPPLPAKFSLNSRFFLGKYQVLTE